MKSLSLHKPHAIIMVGVTGSGKTFFAKKFAETFNAPYVGLEDILPFAYDYAAAQELVYNQLEQLVKTNLSIVVDGDTASRQNRTELARAIRDVGYVPMIVWVQTDPETAQQRISRDKNKRSVDFDAQMKRFSPPHPSEKPVVISGKHTYASQAKIVLKHLSAPRADTPLQTQPPARPSGQNIVVR